MYGNKDTGAGANKLEFISDCYQIYDIQNGELVPVVEPDALDALNTGAKYGVPYMENGTVLSTFVEDASFLRLNTLTVGYTFPKAWTKRLVCSVHVFMQLLVICSQLQVIQVLIRKLMPIRIRVQQLPILETIRC